MNGIVVWKDGTVQECAETLGRFSNDIACKGRSTTSQVLDCYVLFLYDLMRSNLRILSFKL